MFNPDQYGSAADITNAWFAAGQPLKDMYGRDLDVRGMPIMMNGRQMSAPQQTQQVWGQQPGPQFGPVSKPGAAPQAVQNTPQPNNPSMSSWIQGMYQYPGMSQNQMYPQMSMFPQMNMGPMVDRQGQQMPNYGGQSYGGMSGMFGGMQRPMSYGGTNQFGMQPQSSMGKGGRSGK